MSAPTPESEVLRPRDPAIEDDNEWPDFPLTNVEVFDPRTGDFCSLLVADGARALTVHGKLPKSKRRQSSLLHRRIADSLPLTISLHPVQTFSYGQNDAGEVVLWAAGAAGWFEIEPSKAYKSIHKDDCEAVNILYSVADFYRELKGKRVRTTAVKEVFRQYATEPANQCEDAEQAEALFYKHRLFLLDCMRKGKEGVNWKITSIYEHLQHAPGYGTSAGANEMSTPARIELEDPRSRHAGKGKSALRPRSLKSSNKGPGRQRSDSEEDDNLIDSPMPPANSRSSAALQRKIMSAMSGQSRATTDGSAANGESNLSSHEDSQTIPLPLKKRPPTRGGNAKRKRDPLLKIVSEPLPSYEPQGPGDVWTCKFDGCIHHVYAASKPESRELIREHYQKHAYDKQAQIDLVLKEERPYLPVGNLVNKIREMAAMSKARDTAGGMDGKHPTVGGLEQFYPKPIQQKY